MDTSHFHSLIGLTVLEKENLESIMDGQSGREDLGGVELPLDGLEIVEKSAPGAFLQREHTTDGFHATLQAVQVMLYSL